jgi:hypothetical protein
MMQVRMMPPDRLRVYLMRRRVAFSSDEVGDHGARPARAASRPPTMRPAR